MKIKQIITSRLACAIYFTVLINPHTNAQITSERAVKVNYQTEAGVYYQLQKSQSPDAGATWEDAGLLELGDGSLKSWLFPMEGNAMFFRVTKPSNEWALVWQDEFEGTDIDPSKWSHEENHYGGGNREEQYYSPLEKYSYVQDGALHIAVYEDSNTSSDDITMNYTSARLRTLRRADWKYGRFEVRAQMPNGQGIWPAVWLLPSKNEYGIWAASGEIDILESRGSETHVTSGALHFGGTWPKNTYVAKEYSLPDGATTHDGYHTYAMEWTEDEIRWYFDDEHWYTVTKDQWNSFADPNSDTAPFDKEFYMIINVAVNGGFFDNTNQNAQYIPASAFPQILKVDYVRVYKWVE